MPALQAAMDVTGAAGDVEAAAAAFRAGLEAALRLPGLGQARLCAGLVDEWAWVAIVGRLISEAIASVAGPESARGGSLDELQLGPVMVRVFRDLGLDDGAAWRLLALIRMLRGLPLASSVSELPAAGRAAGTGSGSRRGRGHSTIHPRQRLGRDQLVQPRVLRAGVVVDARPRRARSCRDTQAFQGASGRAIVRDRKVDHGPGSGGRGRRIPARQARGFGGRLSSSEKRRQPRRPGAGR